MTDSYLNPCTGALCAVRFFIHHHWRALYIFTNPILPLSPLSVTTSVFHEYLLFWIILSFCSSHTHTHTHTHTLITTRFRPPSGTKAPADNKPNTDQKLKTTTLHTTSNHIHMGFTLHAGRLRQVKVLRHVFLQWRYVETTINVIVFPVFFFTRHEPHLSHFNSRQAHRVLSQEDFSKKPRLRWDFLHCWC